MKKFLRSRLALALAAAVVATLRVHADSAPAGLVDFGKFTPAGPGAEFVEVNVKSNLLCLAARLAEKQEPEAAALLRGIQAVRVNVIGLNQDNRADLESRMMQVRAALETNGWERVVLAQKDKDDVAVFLKIRGDQGIEGLVVTVLSGHKEAVFVNVAGDISTDKLAELGEKLKIEALKNVGDKIKQH